MQEQLPRHEGREVYFFVPFVVNKKCLVGYSNRLKSLCQSKDEPGSVFRPGAISLCPVIRCVDSLG